MTISRLDRFLLLSPFFVFLLLPLRYVCLSRPSRSSYFSISPSPLSSSSSLLSCSALHSSSSSSAHRKVVDRHRAWRRKLEEEAEALYVRDNRSDENLTSEEAVRARIAQVRGRGQGRRRGEKERRREERRGERGGERREGEERRGEEREEERRGEERRGERQGGMGGEEEIS
eukprot:762846-Hanusia_phi.AAC.2